MSAELGDWLRKQIEERKAAAVAAGGNIWTPPPHEMDHMYDAHGDVVVYNEGRPSEEQFAHIALNDPQDTIARCEAELAILDLHALEWRERPERIIGESDDPFCGECSGEPHPCATIRLVASSYRHRPGYKEAWKP